MLIPKKVKHRKWHKGTHRNMGIATRTNFVAFGDYGLKSLEHGWVTSREIEAARRVLTRYVRRGGKIWIRIFPDKPVTKKGNETPMGGGKGGPDHYVAPVKPGTILFEMGGITKESAAEAMKLASYKLRVKARFALKLK
jgi:large subunit ribosomal protein L16